MQWPPLTRLPCILLKGMCTRDYAPDSFLLIALAGLTDLAQILQPSEHSCTTTCTDNSAEPFWSARMLIEAAEDWLHSQGIQLGISRCCGSQECCKSYLHHTKYNHHC